MIKTFKHSDIAVIDSTGDIMMVINHIHGNHFGTLVQRGWIKRDYHYSILDQEINMMTYDHMIEYLNEAA